MPYYPKNIKFNVIFYFCRCTLYECSYWYAHLNECIMFNISSYDFIYTYIYNPVISGIDL